jgi:hypothetical protein
MAHRILVLTDQEWQDLTNIIDHVIEYESEYFYEYANELTKIDGVTQEEYNQALEAFNNEEGDDNQDNLAAVSQHCSYSSAIRLWRKIS